MKMLLYTVLNIKGYDDAYINKKKEQFKVRRMKCKKKKK